jgi:hypothetical protein
MLHPTKIQKDLATLSDLVLVREIRDYSQAVQTSQGLLRAMQAEMDKRIAAADAKEKEGSEIAENKSSEMPH